MKKGVETLSYFYVFKLNKKWVRLGFIIFLAFIAAFILWIEEIGFISASKEDQQAVLIKGNPNYEHLALTFNISWGEEKVYPILDALEKHDVRATFFLNGEWAEKNPHILEDIAENKHEIGMLGYRYESYVDKEIEEVRQDLYKAKEVFDKLNFNDIEFIRAPNGHFNDDIINLTGQLGFKLIHWNVNPNDWENPGTEVIIDHV